MEYLSPVFKRCNLNLQPSNSERIDISSAKEILYPGAHIATGDPYEYFHHGIVLDPNASDISIIHFWGTNHMDSRVQITSLPIFIAGGIHLVGKKTRGLYLINYDGDTKEKQEETVKTAERLLEEVSDNTFDWNTSNCESYACFCRTGKWGSQQTAAVFNTLSNNAKEINEELKNFNEKNKKKLRSILNAYPTHPLSQFKNALED
ncbi:unnamed protein product [Adineta steineri]|uniref:LRAT domain-containing protein n=1 Tax=Adineta steineri TaxID=433720 RepID=A0A819SMR4_9BILA|nr:unnamed protein product [Adineta steineri]CAF4058913.1 unnamed protein product [Adineta steineri]